jgi:predicted secreted protein
MVAQIGSLLAIYFVVWWLVFFATLPFGVRNRAESGLPEDDVAGSDPGAPVATLLARKALWTTVISAVMFAVALYAYRSGWLEIERLSKLMGFPL